MAQRRMFAKTIIDSDAFLDMPATAQLLYFHLAMRADDDGFINQPKSIMRMCGCKDDDIKVLFAKKFVIPFESGIVVIKHWKIHNYIAKDRYTETKYKHERALLDLDENNAYTEKDACPDTACIQSVDTPSTACIQARIQHVHEVETQVRLGKDSTGKESIYTSVIDYLNEKAGTKYRPSSGKTQTLIRARIREGFTLDDFKTVIDKKVSEWKGTDMEKYLRPETLFGTKFEGYLNQKKGGNSHAESQSDYRAMGEKVGTYL